MSDASAARAGFLFAGIALIMGVVTWPVEPAVAVAVAGTIRPPLVALASVSLVAFSLRRHGRLDRTVGSAIAGVASTCVAGYAVAMLVLPPGGGPGSFSIEPLLVLTVGSLAMVAAVADSLGVPAAELLTKSRVVLTGGAVGATGLFVGGLIPLIPILFVVLLVGEISFAGRFVLNIAFLGVGLILVSIVFLSMTDRGLSYLDFRVPSVRDVGYALGGVLALVGAAIVIGFLYQQFDIPGSESYIETAARQEGADLLLLALPLAWLATGLGEELLFRNVVQKYFTEYFSIAAAVVASSVIFTLVHVPAYYDPNPLAMTSTLAVVFSLSLILGVSYVRTENILVPVFIHGTYNAVVYLSIYGTLAGGV